MKNDTMHFEVSAPTRIDLAGGTFDLWPLSTFFAPARTINCAIALAATITVEAVPAPRFSISVLATDGAQFRWDSPDAELHISALEPSLQFPMHLISHFFQGKTEFPGRSINLKIKTEAPAKSGLGGSSALAVAIARALTVITDPHQGQGWQWNLLDWVKDAEAAFLHTPTGVQDYLAALFGSFRSYYFNYGTRKEEPYPAVRATELSERMVVIYSKESHDSAASNWQVFKRVVEKEKNALFAFQRLQQITNQIHSELMNVRCDWNSIGKLITQEWLIRKNELKVSTPHIDKIHTWICEQKGVIGSRVCGAASGGCLITLVQPEHMAMFKQACSLKSIQVLAAPIETQGVRIHYF